ncbi:MAG: DUF2066 domain-containing protein [Proteobacteria bacterium]|nr:DUF2066 domain-containing protein [Pseudomonadota bacterium]
MSRFFFLLACVFTISFSAKADNQDIYLISGVSISTNAKSPALAKAAAFKMARRDAFLILLTRLEMKSGIADGITDEEISDMVRSEQIEKEKISGGNYSATFNIMFAKDFVDYVLLQKKSPNASENKAPEDIYLLIPVKMKKYQSIIWGEENDWKEAIAKTLNQKSLNQFVVPDADIANIASLNEGEVVIADYRTLEPILSRYKAKAAYSLIFSYDEIENKVVIEVIRLSKFQKKKVKLSFVNIDRLNYQSLISKVSDKVMEYLLSSQSDLDQGVNSSATRIKIYLNSLSSWVAIKNKIESSGLVNQLNIESISRDYVVVTINYIGEEDIQKAFARKGLRLNQQEENNFTIDAN